MKNSNIYSRYIELCLEKATQKTYKKQTNKKTLRFKLLQPVNTSRALVQIKGRAKKKGGGGGSERREGRGW